jgi:predicted RNA-binding protein YlqC (UPF0109 family)
LLEFILLRIVEYPESLEIDESQDASYQIFTLHLHPDDVGRVIGKGGKVIKALRKIAQIRAIVDGTHVKIVLAEE